MRRVCRRSSDTVPVHRACLGVLIDMPGERGDGHVGLCDLQEKGYVTADVADAQGLHQLKLSGTKFRKMLRAGEDIPEW